MAYDPNAHQRYELQIALDRAVNRLTWIAVLIGLLVGLAVSAVALVVVSTLYWWALWAEILQELA